MSIHNNMVVVNKLESLLVVPLLVFSIAAQENSGYGSPNFSSSGGDFTGPSGSTGGDRIGPSGGPTAQGRMLGSSAPTGRGRVVSNSILDFEQGPEERENGSRQGYSRQQPGFSSRPITTGPSVVGTNSIEERESQSGLNGPNPNTQEQKIFRYVSVHVPPPDLPPSQRTSPTPSPVKPEIHYQIVFIKAPSPISQELQEIQMPPPPEMKTLVYVLLKKPSMSDLVKISRPKPKPINKPEVFFIRYKPGNQQVPLQPQRQPERRQQFPQQQEGSQQLQPQQERSQQFPQQQPERRQQFPQQQPERRQQFPQQQPERRSQFPQQQEGNQQLQPQQERSQQFPQQQPERRQQFPQQQQQEGRQYPQQQQQEGRQPFPQQRASNNGSNIGNNVGRQPQQQNTGLVLETSASPTYGGYENSNDSIADSDYQNETTDENSFSLSSYDQGLLPEYSYTATSQYGITS